MKKNRKHSLINWFSSFVEAWEMLLDIPLPSNISKAADEDNPDPVKVLCCFTLTGIVAGVAFYLTAWLLSILSGRAAAVMSGFLITVAYEIATKGRMISSVASFTENLFSFENKSDAILKLDDNFRKSRNIFGTIGMVSLFTARMFSIGFIVFSGNISWLIISMAAGFTVQAHLAILPELETEEPFIEVSGKSAYIPWIFFAAACVIFGVTNLPAAVTTGLLVFLSACLTSKYVFDKLGGVNGPMIGILGYFTESIVLLLGLIFLFR